MAARTPVNTNLTKKRANSEVDASEVLSLKDLLRKKFATSTSNVATKTLDEEVRPKIVLQKVPHQQSAGVKVVDKSTVVQVAKPSVEPIVAKVVKPAETKVSKLVEAKVLKPVEKKKVEPVVAKSVEPVVAKSVNHTEKVAKSKVDASKVSYAKDLLKKNFVAGASKVAIETLDARVKLKIALKRKVPQQQSAGVKVVAKPTAVQVAKPFVEPVVAKAVKLVETKVSKPAEAKVLKPMEKKKVESVMAQSVEPVVAKFVELTKKVEKLDVDASKVSPAKDLLKKFVAGASKVATETPTAGVRLNIAMKQKVPQQQSARVKVVAKPTVVQVAKPSFEPVVAKVVKPVETKVSKPAEAKVLKLVEKKTVEPVVAQSVEPIIAKFVEPGVVKVAVDPTVLERIVLLEAKFEEQKRKDKERRERRERRKQREREEFAARKQQRAEPDSKRVRPTLEASVAERSVTEELSSTSVAVISEKKEEEKLAEARLMEEIQADDELEAVVDDTQLAPGQSDVDVAALETPNQEEEEVEQLEFAPTKHEENQADSQEADVGANFELQFSEELEQFASPIEDLVELHQSMKAKDSLPVGDEVLLTFCQVATDPVESQAEESEKDKDEELEKELEEGRACEKRMEESELEPLIKKRPAPMKIIQKRQVMKRKKAEDEVAEFSLPQKKLNKGKEVRHEVEEARLAEERCNTIQKNIIELQAKPFLSEQGFEPVLKGLPAPILNQIESRGWLDICVSQVDARRDWVIEFYASILDRSSYQAVVRERLICWAPKDWNKLFELEDEESEYDRILQSCSSFELASCLEVIGVEGATWEEGPQSKKFLAANLNEEARIWASYVKTCLMPTMHDSTLTLPRALLIYAIIAGLTINVGRIIANEIHTWVGKRVSYCMFPHFISALCSYQGVKGKPNDAILPRKKPLSMAPKASAKVVCSKKKLATPSESDELLKVSKEIRDKLQTFYHYCFQRDAILQQFLDDFDGGPYKLPKFLELLQPPEDQSS